MWRGTSSPAYLPSKYLIIRELRFVRIWNTCRSTASIVSNTRSMKSSAIPLWNRSLIEFTNTIRGRLHFSGCISRSGLNFKSKPLSNGCPAVPRNLSAKRSA